jgi:4-alpha-glucanotransferase
MITRRAGVLIPLFSFPSDGAWGIGEIADVAPMAAWLEGAGQRILQLLPLNEMAPGQSSPYSALSAMAIDPIYIRVPAVSDWDPLDLDAADRASLDAARRAPRVDYQTVRRVKQRALTMAFTRFHDLEWRRDTDRARAFRSFTSSQAWWVDDYALFRAIHAREAERPWIEWPEGLKFRDPAALEIARDDLSREILFHQYLQWIAHLQWQDARAAAGSRGVSLFGDLPFMVDGDSADVWARQDQFDFEVSVGAPPDAFSATGQDWGLPGCRWDVMAIDGFRWLRDRARRSADLFDGYRVDHLVGFYRTYTRPRTGGAGVFSPPAESDQVALGEQILDIFAEPGVEIIAEDLGEVPDFVRASLSDLQIPGFRVLRWERHWQLLGQPFRDPSEYPPISVATSGTHDTEPLATWWDHLSAADRQAVSDMPGVQRVTHHAALTAAPFNPTVRDSLLEALFASASHLVLTPLPDVFGWRDRINEPATVADRNWTFRLPWASDRLADVPEAFERQAMLRTWAERHRR